jgi:hypothetical protein
MSAFARIADSSRTSRHVRLVPIADIRRRTPSSSRHRMPPTRQPYPELAELADFVVDRDFVTIWDGPFWGIRLHQALVRATRLSR